MQHLAGLGDSIGSIRRMAVNLAPLENFQHKGDTAGHGLALGLVQRCQQHVQRFGLGAVGVGQSGSVVLGIK